MPGCLNLQNVLPIVKKFCRCESLKIVEGSAEDFGRLYDNKNDAVVEFLLCGCGESFCGGDIGWTWESRAGGMLALAR
jgi:hypothetical protein